MRAAAMTSALLMASLALGCGKKESATTMVAELAPASGSAVKGSVRFTEKGGVVEIVAEVSGLEPGEHGFHIHDKGDCSAADATSAGGHFNPASVAHGGPGADQHHAGDLGNLTADEKGVAKKTMTSTGITLGEGARSAAGRAVIVHAKPDDLRSQPTGAAGARVACGVIKAR